MSNKPGKIWGRFVESEKTWFDGIPNFNVSMLEELLATVTIEPYVGISNSQ
jgi:hypothetical protein